MLSTRDIQRKIRTVRNIQQICRAMRTVSSIKLRKAGDRINAARPYADALRDMVSRLSREESSHPLLDVREVKAAGLIAISADKGLAGSYNTNLIRDALMEAKTLPELRAFPIGRKVADAFRREGLSVETAINPLGNSPDYRTFAALADHIGQLYTSGTLDLVKLTYTQFGGKVITMNLLPIEPPAGEDAHGDFIYEPNAEAILAELLPRYLRTLLYTAVLSSVAAEHAARVSAMSLATENADDLIDKLTRDYNKSRQAGITNDLTDIVGAAEALR